MLDSVAVYRCYEDVEEWESREGQGGEEEGCR
jgi:hypothetical protein